MKNTILLLATLFVFSSCYKKEYIEPVTEPPREEEKDSSLVWFTDIDPERSLYNTADPIEYDHGIVWGVINLFPPIYEFYQCLDKETGEILWTSPRTYDVSATPLGRARSGDYIVANYDTMVNCFDARTGALHWHYWLPEPSLFVPRISSVGEQVYFSVLEDKAKTINHLIRTTGKNLAWDTVFTYHGSDGWLPYLEPPELWVRPDGDSILFMQDRTSDSLQLNIRVNMIAYNLSQRKVEWIRDDISPTGNSAVYAPKIEEGKVVLGLQYHVICLDAYTGDIIWLKEIGDVRDHIMSCEILVHEGTVFVNPQYTHLLAIDLETGEVNWEYFDKKTIGYSARHLGYYNNRLIKDAGFKFSQIVGHRPKNGSIAWVYETKISDAYYGDSRFIIDQESGRLYAHNQAGITCIQLP